MIRMLMALVFISFFGLGKIVADQSLLLHKEWPDPIVPQH